MKLAIVGSRDFYDYKLLCQKIKEHYPQPPSLIISGGARGADSLAERYAIEFKIPMDVRPANWSHYGKAAGPIRNEEMAVECTHAIAFPSRKGVGTQDMIKRLERKGKPYVVVYYD